MLVKRHVPEVGAPWVRALSSPTAANLIVTARITLAEVYSAFNRRRREKGLDGADYSRITGDFDIICATEYIIIELTDNLIQRTKPLLERYILRAYDAVQLAAAIEARARFLPSGTTHFTFLSADNRLLAAARTEGLTIDNPNDHP